jgi:hypothetical protein
VQLIQDQNGEKKFGSAEKAEQIVKWTMAAKKRPISS